MMVGEWVYVCARVCP